MLCVCTVLTASRQLFYPFFRMLWGLAFCVLTAPTASALASFLVAGETKHQLRRALPAFEQDDQLREALAQCEADMLAADAASTEDEAEAAKRSA